MSTERLESYPATRPPSDRPRRSQMTPLTCFIKLHAVNTRDRVEQAALRLVWDNLSEEDKEPYRVLASMNVPCRPSLAVTREVSPENRDGYNVVQEGTDSWGSTPTLVGDTPSRHTGSQESIATPVNTTRVQFLGNSDEDGGGDNDGDISSALNGGEDGSSPDNLPL